MMVQSDFIFDVNLRDKLLFEDEDYTHTRRYFWAFTFLALVNESIRSMIHAYDETFSDNFWLGKDTSLWPHADPESEDGQSYLAQLGRVRRELEESIDDLRSLTKSNNELRQQIESLREQLYSGSSVKENRMAIEQGENIKILTGVSMLFLPLSFVMVKPQPASCHCPIQTPITLTSPALTTVRLRHGANLHPAQRLALHRHHDHRLRALLHPHLHPADARRHVALPPSAPRRHALL